jgi:hypothetical protein
MRARGKLADMRALQIPQSRMYFPTESSIEEEEASTGGRRCGGFQEEVSLAIHVTCTQLIRKSDSQVLL